MGRDVCEHTLNENGNKDKLHDKVENALHEIAKQEGYKEYKILTRSISTNGGNYFGSLYEVDINGKTADGDKVTNVFIKGVVAGDHLTVMSVSRMFRMETFIYNELFEVFYELQEQADVPASERYNTVKSFRKSIPEAIILENVAKKGYTTLYRMDPVPLKFAQLSIQQLARLHGLSFVLEKYRPEYFEQKIKSITCPYNFNDDFKTLFTNSSQAIAASLDNNARKRFLDYIPKLWGKGRHYAFDAKYKKTLIHNDYRPNNILMKKNDGEVVAVTPVDYQLSYYGCPLIDFMYFIFLGADQQLRRQHLEGLKDLYFDSLTKFLKYFEIDVNAVFPRKEFEDLYRELLNFGLFCFVQVMPFIFALENEIPDLDKDNLSDVVINTDPSMKERARGIIDDLIHWGVL